MCERESAREIVVVCVCVCVCVFVYVCLCVCVHTRASVLIYTHSNSKRVCIGKILTPKKNEQPAICTGQYLRSTSTKKSV